MDLTDKDIDRILKIIDESGYDEIKIEVGDFKLHVRKTGSPGAAEPAGTNEPSPAPAVARRKSRPAPPGPGAPRAEEVPEGLVAVRAPMLGTFYRAPSPGAKPFVEVGDRVKAGDTVCLVEVMKLFNSVNAGTDGIVVKILVENGGMVEHDQVLMLIEHSLIDDKGETE